MTARTSTPSEWALLADGEGVALLRHLGDVRRVAWRHVDTVQVVRGPSGAPNAVTILTSTEDWGTLIPLSPHGGEYSSTETRHLVAALLGERPTRRQ